MLKLKHLAFFICLLPEISVAQTSRTALINQYRRLDSLAVSLASRDLKQMVEVSKNMSEIARQLQVDTMALRAHQVQGEALQLLGNYDGALKLFYENLARAEQIHNCAYQIKFSLLIGRVFQSMNDYSKSQDFMYKAKGYAVDCGHWLDTISINYEIGFNMVARDTGNEEGIRLIEQNLRVAKNLRRRDDILLGIDNLSNLLANLGSPQKALDYELELLPLVEPDPLDWQKVGVYEHLSEIYVMLKNWDKAQEFQRKALTQAERSGSNDWIFECYKLQSMIDEGLGRYQSALANHQRYLSLKDSVYQSQYDEKMAAMSALYDLESKQNTIVLLEKDAAIRQAQVEEQRVLMLVLLLLLVIMFLGIRFMNQRKTNKMRENFAQDLLKAQEQERQMISRELHDSVGQNILFIKNRIKRLVPPPDEPLLKSVDNALEEVRNIAKELYPNQLEHYGLASAVDALCALVQESSGIFVSADLQDVDEKLNREAKINCYRIIQECISNTLKHAGASAIRISSNVSPGKVELIVQDNGKGFDKSLLERKAQHSFGMINIAERIRMLRGKFDLETSANKGARLSFTIPV